MFLSSITFVGTMKKNIWNIYFKSKVDRGPRK